MKTLFLSLFVASISFASDCSVPAVLSKMRPGAVWVIRNNDPKTLTWQSTQPIPSSKEINDAVSQCQEKYKKRMALKSQAKIIVNDVNLQPTQRLNALLILLDLDK
jgi:hypothetical protein